MVNSLTGVIQKIAPPVSAAANKVGKAIQKVVQVVANHMGAIETVINAVAR